MKCSLGLFLLVCCVTLSLGVKHYGIRFSSAGLSLQCYKCEDYTGVRCAVQQVCSYEDACLYLHEKGLWMKFYIVTFLKLITTILYIYIYILLITKYITILYKCPSKLFSFK
uniref:UPAR/Ly6 domain-containing protein n=1 Tax=Sinocyclocheilus anshuiensis TaxID=1608454 RepID=A0A671L8I1_9TELE